MNPPCRKQTVEARSSAACHGCRTLLCSADFLSTTLLFKPVQRGQTQQGMQQSRQNGKQCCGKHKGKGVAGRHRGAPSEYGLTAGADNRVNGDSTRFKFTVGKALGTVDRTFGGRCVSNVLHAHRCFTAQRWSARGPLAQRRVVPGRHAPAHDRPQTAPAALPAPSAPAPAKVGLWSNASGVRPKVAHGD